MSGYPKPVSERPEPWNNRGPTCARCDEGEWRIKGFCSVYCKDMHDEEARTEFLETQIAVLEAERDAKISTYTEFLEARIAALEAELADRVATIGAIVDHYRTALDETNRTIKEARDRIAAFEETVKQYDKDWLFIMREISRFDKGTDWENAHDEDLLEQFDPWEILRALAKLEADDA